MNTQKTILLGVLFFLIFSNQMRSQDDLKFGVNEVEKFYAENYTAPKKVEFVFTGNPKYIKYFYTDLEQKIKRKFLKKDIAVSFRYLNQPTHYETNKEYIGEAEYIFLLNIDNSVTIDEKNGSDRLMKFDLSGRLTSKKDATVQFRFKSSVFVIHDINNKNEEVANYLLYRLTVR